MGGHYFRSAAQTFILTRDCFSFKTQFSEMTRARVVEALVAL